MRLCQFITWTYKYMLEAFLMVLFLILMAAILAALAPISSFWLLFILSIILILISAEVVMFISRCWKEFNDYCPTEDIAIMRKLKGIPTPIKEIYYD